MKKKQFYAWIVLLVFCFLSEAVLAQSPGTWRVERQLLGLGDGGPRLDVEGRKVMMAFLRGYDVWFTQSNSGGIVWNEPIPIASPTQSSGLNLSKGTQVYHIVYSAVSGFGWETYHSFSYDGIFWSPPFRISSGRETDGGSEIVAFGDRAVAFWIEYSNNPAEPDTIVYRIWTDATGWETDHHPLFTYQRPQERASIGRAAAKGMNVYFTWVYEDLSNLYGDIYYKKSTDGGVSWDALPTNISQTPNYTSTNPDITIDRDGQAFVLWTDDNPTRNPYNKMLIRSKRIGDASFVTITPDPLSPIIDQHLHSVAADNIPVGYADSDTLRVVWKDLRSFWPRGAIYFDKTQTLGPQNDGWILPNDQEYRVSRNYYSYSPFNPDIVSVFLTFPLMETVGLTHVAWEVGNGGNVEIYYRKNYRDDIVPAPATNLQCMVLCDLFPAAFVWWNPSASFDVGAYILERSEDRGPWIPRDTVETTSAIDPIATCTPSYQQYCYRVKTLDLAENQSGYSNVQCLGYSTDSGFSWVVDAGLPEASKYTVERSGYTVWGNGKGERVDFGNSRLVYKFTGLDKNAKHILSLVYYESPEDSGRVQDMNVDGMILQKNYSIPEKVTPKYFILPNNLIEDGKILLTLNKVKGKNVVVSRLVLWEIKGKGGPQSLTILRENLVSTSLFPAYPNPMKGKTNIDYSVSRRGNVSLSIYNVSGQLVKTLVEEENASGRHTIRWDGKDISGKDVPSGVYFYRLKTTGFEETKRLIVLR